MTQTPTLGLQTFNTASGSATTFLDFRLALADQSSNMSKIDDFASVTSGSILALQTNSVFTVLGYKVSTYYYEATVAGIGSYYTGMLINIKLDVTNGGYITLNINSLGVKYLKRINSVGAITDFTANEILLNRRYLFVYDGTQFILFGGVTNIDEVNAFGGTVGNIVNISGSHVLQDSGYPILTGISSGSYNQVQVDVTGRITSGSLFSYQTVSSIAGSSVMSGTTGSVVKHNTSGIISGSYNRVLVDSFGHVTAGSVISSTGFGGTAPINVSGSIISHNTSGIVSGSYNQILVDTFGHITAGSIVASSGAIAGSSVMSNTSGSVVKHNSSGVTSGSYNQVFVDVFGHVTAGSIVASGGMSSIAGSSVMSSTTGSVVIHNVSGVTSGSYNKFEVDKYGHITAGSIVYGTGGAYTSDPPIVITGSNNISHATSGIVSGSYNVVQVNSFGHVTAGSVTSSSTGNSVEYPLSPYYQAVPTISGSNWTWVNQSTASAQDETAGGIYMSSGSNSNNHCFLLVRPLTQTTNYKVTGCVIATLWSSFNRFGICLHSTSSSMVMYAGFMADSDYPGFYPIVAQKWNNPTEWGETYIEDVRNFGNRLWFQLEDNSTTLKFKISVDGTHFFDYYSMSSLSVITPNRAGILLESEGGIPAIGGWLRSWKIEYS